MRRMMPYLVTAVAAVLAAWGLRRWLSHEAPTAAALRAAAAAGSLAEAAAAATLGETDLAGCFKADSAIPPGTLAGTWPGFRGPARDNIALESGRLAEAWGRDGPRVLWSIDVGDGHAMPALSGGNLYLLDYDEARGGDCLRCLNADTGQERWEHLYAVKTKRNHGISRTVAATDGEAVVSIGPQCHVLCLGARDGAYRWGVSLPRRYGTKVPLWYTGQCPLIDSGLAILAPAGTNVLFAGLDLKSGETVFETPNPGGLVMSHASIMVLTVDGVRQYVYAALGGIVGVAAEGEMRGHLLWRAEAFNPSVIAPSPVPLSGGRFFMTAGYGSGGAMFRVSRVGGVWRVELLFKTDRKQFASEQQTPVFHDGRLYTVLPSDGGGDRQQFVCMTPEGERLWASGPAHTFGLGPYVLTPDGLAVLLDDVGTLTLARVGPDGFRVLARHELMGRKGRDAWGPMILVNGRLFLRDSARLYCLDLGGS